MSKINLDVKDKKILYELDMDARQPFSSIAKKVGLSKEVVNYRIKELERKGVIEGYYAMLDCYKIGYTFWRVYLRYHNISPEIEKEILEYLKKNPVIGWVTVGDGKWDLSVIIWAKDIHDFEKSYDDLIFKYGRYFGEKYVGAAFRIYHFKQNCLYGTKDNSYLLMGEPGQTTADKTDLEILYFLSKNARTSALDIGKKLNCTGNTIKNRIKRLIKEKVIIGYRAKLNYSLLGYDYYKVLLHLENLTKKKLNQIITTLNMNPNVIYITKSFGDAELEFEVLFKTKNELYKLMKKMKQKYVDIIRDYETVLFCEVPLINYFPVEVSYNK